VCVVGVRVCVVSASAPCATRASHQPSGPPPPSVALGSGAANEQRPRPTAHGPRPHPPLVRRSAAHTAPGGWRTWRWIRWDDTIREEEDTLTPIPRRPCREAHRRSISVGCPSWLSFPTGARGQGGGSRSREAAWQGGGSRSKEGGDGAESGADQEELASRRAVLAELLTIRQKGTPRTGRPSRTVRQPV
jgi:hypothetical protein